MNEVTATPEGIPSRRRRTLLGRLQAAGIRFGISLLIFAIAMVLILRDWYPGFHFIVDGGWQGMRLLVVVELVLGPLLTLVVFNPLKARRLIVFDLVCIGLLQASAVAWGFYAIHSQRPVAVSHLDGAFYSMTAEPFRTENQPVSLLAGLSERRPALVHVRAAEDENEEIRKMMMELAGGLAEHEDPFFFQQLALHWAEIEAGALDVTRHALRDPKFPEDLGRFLSRHGGTAGEYRFFPYTGRYGACTVVFTAAGEFVGALACQGF
jgi:hypothetical protein